jgi:hypothetical protein
MVHIGWAPSFLTVEQYSNAAWGRKEVFSILDTSVYCKSFFCTLRRKTVTSAYISCCLNPGLYGRALQIVDVLHWQLDFINGYHFVFKV